MPSRANLHPNAAGTGLVSSHRALMVSVALGHHASVWIRPGARRLNACSIGAFSIIFKLEPRIVGTKSHRPIQRRQLTSERALPCHLAVGRHSQITAAKLGA